MPELPEVETIRRDLEKKIIGKKILEVKIRKKKMVKGSYSDFRKSVFSGSFREVSRRGKLLIFSLENLDKFLLLHLKMTGQLIYRSPSSKITAGGHSEEKTDFNLPNKYSHIFFCFKDGSHLFFNDQRQFGYVKIANKKELDEVLDKFGIEALDESFAVEKLEKILQKRTKNIKAVLLDQTLIAGIGNIYADEILFASKILPDRAANTLRSKEKEALLRETKNILKRAIKKRGTTFNNYLDADGNKGNFLKELQVYQREGERCFVCGEIIQKAKVAGRGTRFCPSCQG